MRPSKIYAEILCTFKSATGSASLPRAAPAPRTALAPRVAPAPAPRAALAPRLAPRKMWPELRLVEMIFYWIRRINSVHERFSTSNVLSCSALVMVLQPDQPDKIELAWNLLKCFFAPLFRVKDAWLKMNDLKNKIFLPNQAFGSILRHWVLYWFLSFDYFFVIFSLEFSLKNKIKSSIHSLF